MIVNSKLKNLKLIYRKLKLSDYQDFKKLFYSLQEKYLKDSYYTGEHVDNKIWEAYERVTTKTEINV